MPNSLGMGEKWDAQQGGACGMPREKRKGEEERAWGVSKGGHRLLVGCYRDLRGGPFK